MGARAQRGYAPRPGGRCRGRVVAGRPGNTGGGSGGAPFEFEVAFATGALAEARRVVDGGYVGVRPTRRLARDAAICACVVAHLCEDADAGPFLAPVPVDAYPTYRAAIAPNQPSDLGTVLWRLDVGGAAHAADVQRAVRNIWNNCKRFNAPQSELGGIADALGMRAARLFTAWLAGGDDVPAAPADAVACAHCDRPSAVGGGGDGAPRCARCAAAGARGDLPRRSEEAAQRERAARSGARTVAGAAPHRGATARSREYLVKWRGRSYVSSSWEAAADIAGDREAAAAIAEFANRRPRGAVTPAAHGALFVAELERATIPRIDIQPILCASPAAATSGDLHALRVSNVHPGPFLPVGVGDVICQIGGLEVLGRRLDEIGAQIQEALDAPSVSLVLFRPRPGASHRAAAAAAATAWRNRPAASGGADGGGAAAPPPRALRDYQVAGVGWLVANFAAGRGCILADEMGLGKTAQACRTIAAVLADGGAPNAAALVVAPLSTIEQWRRELDAWAPDLEVCVYHDATARGRELIRHFEWGDGTAPKFDVVVCVQTNHSF